MKISFFLLLLAIVSLGCNQLASKWYGIQAIHTVDTGKCSAFVGKIDFKGISHTLVYADTFAFRYAARLNSLQSGLRKPFSQPTQILYFRNDSLLSFHANCFAQSHLGNLNWNTAKRFERFVPVTAIALDSVKFNFRKYIRQYSIPELEPGYTYTVVIVWTRMMEKISQAAIETVIGNISQFHQEANTRIVLINADEVFKTS